jgi:large subunit ribosomal protein L33
VTSIGTGTQIPTRGARPDLAAHPARRFSEHLAGFLVMRYIGYSKRYTIMSQDKLIQLKNKSTGEVYWTRKNKKTVEKKIELKKYSAKLRKHVVFKEAKK